VSSIFQIIVSEQLTFILSEAHSSVKWFFTIFKSASRVNV